MVRCGSASFDLPPVKDAGAWEGLKRKTFEEAERFASLGEAMSEDRLWRDLDGEKSGNHHRNIPGVAEPQ